MDPVGIHRGSFRHDTRRLRCFWYNRVMKLIPIYGGMPHGGHWSVRRKHAVVVAHAQVDDDVHETLSKLFWTLSDRGSKRRGKSHYAITRINGRTVRMHCLVLHASQGFEVSHEDGDPLNNQRSNLKAVSHSENMLNANDGAYQSNKSTGIRNVHRFRNGFRAKVEVRGKVLNSRVFDTVEEAAAAAAELRAKAIVLSGNGA